MLRGTNGQLPCRRELGDASSDRNAVCLIAEADHGEQHETATVEYYEHMALYLGLDVSTQSLTALVLRVEEGRSPGSTPGARRAVVFEHSISFDAALPRYGTRHGVLPSENSSVAVSSPLLWAEALELMMDAIAGSGLDLSRLAAIAGSAQQHGSVYLNDTAAYRLAHLDPDETLVDQIGPRAGSAPSAADPSVGIFSRPIAPIWMDASTPVECLEITDAIGGADRLARITGSRAFERFSGPQIRKFYKRQPDAWAATDRVHLVSSFMASLLLGGHAPLDPGDASGMNLMDLSTRRWSPDAVGVTAPNLTAKLPAIVPSATIIGGLGRYWQRRFELPPSRLAVWSGDNPSSLVGTGVVREGQITVSLGTSDTVFGPMREPRVDTSGTGHVFGAPTGDYMGLTCFRNGSLARERVRDEHGLDWDGFSKALRSTSPGNGGAMMIPWFEPEITPKVSAPGVHRFDLDSTDAARNVRAVVEGQMMALANHCAWMGANVDVIHATGGAAANVEILQIMADVFGADVHRFEVANSACLGAALRAYHAHLAAGGNDVAWAAVVQGVATPVAGSSITPDPACVRLYADMRRRYADLESRYIG